MKASKYLFLSLVTLLSSCGNKNSETTVAPVNVTVMTAGVSASISDKNYVGEIEPEITTAVSSLAPGTVLKMYAEEGQRVSKGQVIAVMDNTQAKNALDAANAILEQAKDAYHRMKVLHEKKSISEMDWVSVQSKFQQAQASVETCRKVLNDCVIKAPCNGIIGKKSAEAGMTVLPTQPLCTIINIKNVKVKISVPEMERSLFSPYTETTITVKALNKTFKGGRVETGVEGNSVSRTYNVYVNLDNSGQKLMPGMVCDVKVEGNNFKSKHSNAICLPISAVHRRASGDMFVWKAVDGVAKRCRVKTGVTSGDVIQIVEGVANGDRIIVDGYQKVSDGNKINEIK